MTQTVIVTGANGQLGRELQRIVPQGTRCIALARADLDIVDEQAVADCLRKHHPELLINAAAYTAVDQAESDVAAAAQGNAIGPGVLAAACADNAARFIHISTDFVFDGRASSPYLPNAATAPQGEYGRSKLAGERAVQDACSTALILRTSWVYSAFGSNFVKTMLRLMAERTELGVVDDQVGTPTWACGLAEVVWAAAQRPQLRGIYHWSDAGVCSWYDFALAIYEEGRALGLLQRDVAVNPIATQAYPTPAERPAFSVLDKRSSWRDFEVPALHWRVQLRAMLRDLQELENG